MKHLIYLVSILFFLTIFCDSVSAQRGYYEQEYEMPFQPRFILGSSYYNSLGDIKGPNAGNLLGNIGFKSGVSFNLNENVDLSLLFKRYKLAEESDSDKFSSEIRSFGLHFDYTLNKLFKNNRLSPLVGLGINNINFKTINYFNSLGNEKKVYDDESSFNIPANIGLSLNVSERIKLNLSYNYILNFSDIDKYQENDASDNISMVDFTICYDFFTKIPREKPIDDSFYSDVNFEKFDIEDTDGDMVSDNDDHCPETPQGVKVDEKGCPIDTDNDGIADYLDQQINSRYGALVDENGIELTEDKYESTYGYVAATRKYAHIYNESEIKKEDYLNINDFLIAKANEFNNSYNQSVQANELVSALIYRVEIGRYSGDIPEEDEIKMLMLNDLESTTQGDYVVYMVGKYNSKDDALKREYELDSQGFLDCYILVDNNGKIEKYTPPAPVKPEQEEIVQASDDLLSQEKIDTNQVLKINEPVYRVQIGAFKEALPEQVFDGVNNVISMKDKDGFIKYMTGSFTNKKDGVDYMFQMRARGFEDAFLVAYKNGKRTIEFFVPKTNVDLKTKENNKKESKNTAEKEQKKSMIEFTVQILVTDQALNADQLKSLEKFKDVEKIQVGTNMFAYYAGSFNKIQNANKRLNEAKNLGFENAFIFASENGVRITIEEALNK